MSLEELIAEISAPSADDARRRIQEHEFIAHYTTGPNFISMLQSEELWLSNVMAMSDVNEIRRGCEIIEASAQETILKFPGLASPAVHELFRHFSDLYPQIWANTYALSFSAHDRKVDAEGRLSMWRAYASDGDGVCLVLKRANLMRNEDLPFPVMAMAMHYEDEPDFLGRVGIAIGHAANVLKERQVDASSRVAQWLAYYLVLLAMSHKHIGFIEERELRLIHIKGLEVGGDVGLSYASVPSGRIVKPVVKVKARHYPEQGLNDTALADFLVEVIVGPSHSAGVQAHALRQALEERGLSHVPVRQSTIPYRAPR